MQIVFSFQDPGTTVVAALCVQVGRAFGDDVSSRVPRLELQHLSIPFPSHVHLLAGLDIYQVPAFLKTAYPNAYYRRFMRNKANFA